MYRAKNDKKLRRHWRNEKEKHSNDVNPTLWIDMHPINKTKIKSNQPMFTQVRVERAGYAFRAAHASNYGDALSMVVDGSDNSGNGLPHFSQMIQIMLRDGISRYD